MSDAVKTALQVMLAVFAAMLLSLLVPALFLLKLFLVLVGGLIIAGGVSTVNHLIRYQQYQQMLRELEIKKKTQKLPSDQSQVSTPHEHRQRCLRRLQRLAASEQLTCND